MPRLSRATTSPLGIAIREARNNHKYTLAQAAERSGCSSSMLSQIELGKTTPSEELLRDIERGLGLPKSALQKPWAASVESGVVGLEKALQLLQQIPTKEPADILKLLENAPSNLPEEIQWRLSAARAQALYALGQPWLALVYAHHTQVELLAADVEDSTQRAIEFCRFAIALSSELGMNIDMYEAMMLPLLKSPDLPVGTIMDAYAALGTINPQHLQTALRIAQAVADEEAQQRISKLIDES